MGLEGGGRFGRVRAKNTAFTAPFVRVINTAFTFVFVHAICTYRKMEEGGRREVVIHL